MRLYLFIVNGKIIICNMLKRKIVLFFVAFVILYYNLTSKKTYNQTHTEKTVGHLERDT